MASRSSFSRERFVFANSQRPPSTSSRPDRLRDRRLHIEYLQRGQAAVNTATLVRHRTGPDFGLYKITRTAWRVRPYNKRPGNDSWTSEGRYIQIHKSAHKNSAARYFDELLQQRQQSIALNVGRNDILPLSCNLPALAIGIRPSTTLNRFLFVINFLLTGRGTTYRWCYFDG